MTRLPPEPAQYRGISRQEVAQWQLAQDDFRRVEIAQMNAEAATAAMQAEAVAGSGPALTGAQRAEAHALGVYDAGAGAVESAGYSFGVVGTAESRAAWAVQTSRAAVEGIRSFANDPSGAIGRWWDNFTGDDPVAIRQATAQGTGLALGVASGVAMGRLQSGVRLGAASDSAAAIHPGRLAAESSEVTQQSLLRALRQAGTPESLATAKLISRGRLDVNILATDPSGRGLGGLYRFGSREIEIYGDAFSTPIQAAGYATHETTHFMQGLSRSNYHLGHEFDAFRAQGGVDLGHWTNGLSDAGLYDLLTGHPVYRGVRPDPNWPR